MHDAASWLNLVAPLLGVLYVLFPHLIYDLDFILCFVVLLILAVLPVDLALAK